MFAERSDPPAKSSMISDEPVKLVETLAATGCGNDVDDTSSATMSTVPPDTDDSVGMATDSVGTADIVPSNTKLQDDNKTDVADSSLSAAEPECVNTATDSVGAADIVPSNRELQDDNKTDVADWSSSTVEPDA